MSGINKVTIEFSGDVEGESKLKRMMQAEDLHSALYDFSQQVLRNARKYESSTNSELNDLLKNEDVSKAIDLIEEEFYKVLNEYNINLFDEV